MGSRNMAAMPSGRITTGTILTMIAVFIITKSIPSVGAMPVKEGASKDIITGSEFLSVLIGSDPNDQQLVHDINKKEAPRIDQLKLKNLSDELILDDAQGREMNRNSRSSKEEHNKENTLKNDFNNDSSNDDLQSEGSSFYSETANERLKNAILNPIDDNVPKIIGVRVTSSVAIGRGNNTSQIIEKTPPISENVKETIKNTKFEESPTTWRPSIFRFLNRDFYKGASSNRHTVSTLPGTLIGANEDYIQQQKEREMNKKKSDIIHPYQRAISYRGNQREGLKPRSYSYSSVINTFTDPKLTTINEWSSTKAESVATEATAGYVTIINHNGDNSVDEIKDLEVDFPVKKSIQSVPALPIVYSEPAKIYSEPAKIYSEPAKIYGKPEKIYSEPAKVYSEPAKNYGEPAKVYGEPAKIYSEPAKIYGEPAKIYSQPAYMHESVLKPKENVQPELSNAFKDPNQLFKLNDHNVNGTKGLNDTFGRIRGTNEQNYEVDESVSVNTNGRTHGVQEKPTDDSQKVGYVVEGRNYRKYRVEERTSDGFIVGEYGVVSHDDGSLRGVRYTADGTTNPRLIYDALMKFLSL